MYTEDEAYEKQCHLRFGGTYPEMNRPCIASQCMAWRWVRTHINNPDDPGGDLIPSSRTYGYCGLAGRPE